MKPNVAIIILNWNGWKDTKECLESLYQIDYPKYNVILVDNASKDDSIKKIKDYCMGKLKVKSDFFIYNSNNKPIKILEFIKEELKNIKTIPYEFSDLSQNNKLIIIKNDKNYGFAEGNNIGIKFALNNLNPDYVLLLNNDTVVNKDFLIELVNIGESKENIGIVGPKTYYYNFESKKNIIGFAGGKLNLLKGTSSQIGALEEDKGQYNNPKEVGYVEGSCFLVKRKIFDRVGFLDSRYFAYWEEVDYCMRSLKLGYKSFYAPKSTIWHKGGMSKNENYTFLITRNMFFFMKTNTTLKVYITFLLYFFGFKFWFLFVYFLFYQKNYSNLKNFLIGIHNGLNQKD